MIISDNPLIVVLFRFSSKTFICLFFNVWS